MTSENYGDDSVTDAADASVDPLVDDDAAFSWAGDESDDVESALDSLPAETTTLDAPPAATTTLETQPATDTTATATREPLNNASLVLVGLIAGVYLLYSIGWYLGGGRIDAARGTLLSDFGYHATYWLAVALPPLWFTASMLGTKKRWTRITALLVGAALCIPWPFVMVGALGV